MKCVVVTERRFGPGMPGPSISRDLSRGDGIPAGPLRLKIEVATGRGEDALHFVAVQRLGQDIECSEIQHFGPKVVVCGTRGDHQQGWRGQAAKKLEYLFPAPSRDTALGQHHLHGMTPQGTQRLPPVAGLEEPPARLAKNVMDKRPIILVAADQQGGHGFLASTIWHGTPFRHL